LVILASRAAEMASKLRADQRRFAREWARFIENRMNSSWASSTKRWVEGALPTRREISTACLRLSCGPLPLNGSIEDGSQRGSVSLFSIKNRLKLTSWFCKDCSATRCRPTRLSDRQLALHLRGQSLLDCPILGPRILAQFCKPLDDVLRAKMVRASNCLSKPLHSTCGL